MNHAVVILRRAREDVDRIFERLAHRSKRGAARWYTAFLQAAGNLGVEPENRALAAESRLFSVPIRQQLFKTRHGRTYRILFTVADHEVLILRVRGPGQRSIRRRDLNTSD